MIIKFSGECSQLQLNQHINTIVTDVVKRAELELTDVKVKDVQVGVVMLVDGEPSYLQVTHEGILEIFQVYVKLDENGEIEGAPVDNQEVSFLDDYTKALHRGEDYNFKDPIESEYEGVELKTIHTVDGGDIVETHYTIIDGDHAGDLLVQYQREGVLVAEFRIAQKQEEQADAVVTETE